MATKHGKTLKQIHDTELSVTRGQSTLFNGIKKYYSIVVGPRKKFLGFFFIFIFFEVVVVWGKGSFSKTNDCIPSIDFIKRSLIWWLKKTKKIQRHCQVWKGWYSFDLVLITSHVFLTDSGKPYYWLLHLQLVSSANLNGNATCPGLKYLHLIQMYQIRTSRKSSHFRFKWCTENSFKLLLYLKL